MDATFPAISGNVGGEPDVAMVDRVAGLRPVIAAVDRVAGAEPARPDASAATPAAPDTLATGSTSS